VGYGISVKGFGVQSSSFSRCIYPSARWVQATERVTPSSLARGPLKAGTMGGAAGSCSFDSPTNLVCAQAAEDNGVMCAHSSIAKSANLSVSKRLMWPILINCDDRWPQMSFFVGATVHLNFVDLPLLMRTRRRRIHHRKQDFCKEQPPVLTHFQTSGLIRNRNGSIKEGNGILKMPMSTTMTPFRWSGSQSSVIVCSNHRACGQIIRAASFKFLRSDARETPPLQ